MQVHRPVAVLTVFLAAGILSARFIPAAFVVSVPLFVLLFIMSILLKFRLNRPFGALMLCGCACFFLGNFLFCQKEIKSSARRIQGYPGRMTALGGKILYPVSGGAGLWRLELEPSSLDGDPVPVKNGRCRIILRSKKLYEKLLPLDRGRNVSLLVFPQSRRAPSNPCQTDYAWQDKIRGIDGSFYAAGMIGQSPPSGSSDWGDYIYKARTLLKNRIMEPLPQDLKGFISGIALGTREELPREQEKIMIDTGTMHVFAASGLHVSIVIGICLLILKFFGLKKPVYHLLAILPVIFYALIAGGSPSIVRASVMGILMLAALSLDRDYDVLNSLAVAAFIMLAVNPYNLFLISFQLSFTAVFGIVTGYGPIRSLMPSGSDIYKRLSGLRIYPWLHRSIRIIYEGVSGLSVVSMAAVLFVSPLIAYYFNRVSLVNLPANIILVPLSGLILPLCIAGGLISMFLPVIGVPLIKLSVYPACGALFFLKFLGNLPMSSIRVLSPGMLFFILYYLMLILIIIDHQFIVKYKKNLILGGVIFSVIVLAGSLISRAFCFNAVFFDTPGQQAVLLKDGYKNHLILAGFPGLKNSGGGSVNRPLTDYLEKTGILTIDTLILTCGRNSRRPVLTGITGNMAIGRIIVCNEPAVDKSLAGRLKTARKLGIPVDYVRNGVIAEGKRILIKAESLSEESPLTICVYNKKSSQLLISLKDDINIVANENSKLMAGFLKLGNVGEFYSPYFKYAVSDNNNMYSPSEDGALIFAFPNGKVKRINWRKAFGY